MGFLPYFAPLLTPIKKSPRKALEGLSPRQDNRRAKLSRIATRKRAARQTQLANAFKIDASQKSLTIARQTIAARRQSEAARRKIPAFAFPNKRHPRDGSNKVVSA